jgi:hypothetical protein
MKKYLAALLVTLGLMLVMAVPALAQPEEFPGQGSGASDPQPGLSEKNRSPQSSPPEAKPGTGRRNVSAAEHDPSDPRTGRGKRIEESSQ